MTETNRTRYVQVNAVEVYRGGASGRHMTATYLRPLTLGCNEGVLLLTPDEARGWSLALAQAAIDAEAADELATAREAAARNDYATAMRSRLAWPKTRLAIVLMGDWPAPIKAAARAELDRRELEENRAMQRSITRQQS